MAEEIKNTYYDQRLPDLIAKLKSQVAKNMDIINKEVESSIGEEKYLNVLKGRRLAVSYCLSTLDKIDKLTEENYREQILPTLIERLKEMVDISLKVIDLDIDDESTDEDDENMDDSKLLTEDKYHLVLKARDMAGEDTQWVLLRINELERELSKEELQEVKPKKSWALIAAEKK